MSLDNIKIVLSDVNYVFDLNAYDQSGERLGGMSCYREMCGRVVGYRIGWVSVVPALRGMGLGQKLYDHAISTARSKKAKLFLSDVYRTPDAEKAWSRLRGRYPVRFDVIRNRYVITLTQR